MSEDLRVLLKKSRSTAHEERTRVCREAQRQLCEPSLHLTTLLHRPCKGRHTPQWHQEQVLQRKSLNNGRGVRQAWHTRRRRSKPARLRDDLVRADEQKLSAETNRVYHHHEKSTTWKDWEMANERAPEDHGGVIGVYDVLGQKYERWVHSHIVPTYMVRGFRWSWFYFLFIYREKLVFLKRNRCFHRREYQCSPNFGRAFLIPLLTKLYFG